MMKMKMLALLKGHVVEDVNAAYVDENVRGDVCPPRSTFILRSRVNSMTVT